MLFIQHQRGPFLPRIQAMLDDGLRVEGCWFVDIPYSTNERVRDCVEELGGPPEQMAPAMDDPLAKYSARQSDRVAALLRSMPCSGGQKRLLVIDDGAYFLRTLHGLASSGPGLLDFFAGRTAVVEQTTRGHRHLEGPKYGDFLSELRAPAVSIVRCTTKKETGSPSISRTRSLRRMTPTLKRLGTPVSGFFGGPLKLRNHGDPGAKRRLLLGNQPLMAPPNPITSIERLVAPLVTIDLGYMPSKGFITYTLPLGGPHLPDRPLFRKRLILAQASCVYPGGEIRRTNSVPLVLR